MVRFTLRLLTPLMFFAAVMMYLADFRVVSIALGAVGIAFHFLFEELRSDR